MTDGATRAVLRTAPGPLKPGLDADASAKNGGYMRRSWVLAAPIAALALLLISCPEGGILGPGSITDPILPAAPGPLEGQLTIDSRPTIVWTVPDGAAGYELQYRAATPTLEDVVGETAISLSGNSYQLPSPIPFYYDPVLVGWRARAMNSDGEFGDWSAIHSFYFSPYPQGFDALPEDAGATTDPTPLLDWDDIHGAVGYRIQVCMNGDWDGTTYGFIVDDDALAASQYQVLDGDSVTLGATRGWRIHCTPNGTDWTDPSPWMTFSVAWTAPSGLSPADGYVTFDQTPTVSWAALDGATGYRVRTAATAEGIAAATDNAVLPGDLSWTFTEPATPGQTVWWSVSAINGEATSELSAPRSIVVSDLFVPTPVAPADAAAEPDYNVTIDWAPLVGASSYELEVVPTNSFTGAATHTMIATDSTSLEVPAGSTRWWKVRARNDSGTYTAWMGPWSFTVAWDDAVTATSPSSGFDQTPLLDWLPVADGVGVSSYRLVTGLSPESLPLNVADGKDVAVGAGISEWEYGGTDIAFGSTLYWAVQPVNSEGVAGAWSDAFAYTATLPSAPTLVAPADVATVTGQPTLDWSAVWGTDVYQIEMRLPTDPFTGTATNSSVIDSYATSGIPEGSSRQWRVRAVNDSGAMTAWSASRTFAVEWIPIFAGVSPAPDTILFDQSPYLSWTDIAAADSYVLVYTRNGFTELENRMADSDFWEPLVANQYQVPDATPFGGTLYWAFMPVNAEGFNGPWSGEYRVGATNDIGARNNLPVDGAILTAAAATDMYVQSGWTNLAVSSGQIAGWKWVVARNYALTDNPVNISYASDISYPGFTVPAGSFRYWKTCAVNDDGDESLWSPVYSFSVEWTGSKPTLTAPADGAVIPSATTSTSLTWNAVSGAASYNLVLTTPAGKSEISVGDTSFAVASQAGAWSWYVIPLNSEGFPGTASDQWAFTWQ